MSAYVTLPKQDWVNALDAVRAKTGTSDLIASAELAGKISGISGGGSGSESVETCTVTISGYASLNFVDITTYVDGQIVTNVGLKTPTIENAIRGSVFTVNARCTSNSIGLTNASLIRSTQTAHSSTYVFICKVE